MKKRKVLAFMLEPVEGYEEPAEQDTDHTVVYIIAGGAVCIAAVVTLVIVLAVKRKKKAV